MAGDGAAADRAAGDKDQDPAVFEHRHELLADGGRVVIVGEHRAGAGFLKMVLDRLIELGAFLDEPGDLAPGEEFLELRDLVEAEAAGDDEAAGGGNAVGVEK